MLYRIKSIKHSENLSDRTDGRYPKRIGRIVDLDIDGIAYSQRNILPMIIRYVKDEYGNDYPYTLRTSTVLNYEVLENTVTVNTRNSIYEFEKV